MVLCTKINDTKLCQTLSHELLVVQMVKSLARELLIFIALVQEGEGGGGGRAAYIHKVCSRMDFD